MQRSPSPNTSKILKAVFGEDEGEKVIQETLTPAAKIGPFASVARAVPVTGRSKNLARTLILPYSPIFMISHILHFNDIVDLQV